MVVFCGKTIHLTAKVSEEVNRKCPPRNTTVQPSTVYPNPERHNAQCHRQMIASRQQPILLRAEWSAKKHNSNWFVQPSTSTSVQRTVLWTWLSETKVTDWPTDILEDEWALPSPTSTPHTQQTKHYVVRQQQT